MCFPKSHFQIRISSTYIDKPPQMFAIEFWLRINFFMLFKSETHFYIELFNKSKTDAPFLVWNANWTIDALLLSWNATLNIFNLNLPNVKWSWILLHVQLKFHHWDDGNIVSSNKYISLSLSLLFTIKTLLVRQFHILSMLMRLLNWKKKYALNYTN